MGCPGLGLPPERWVGVPGLAESPLSPLSPLHNSGWAGQGLLCPDWLQGQVPCELIGQRVHR